MYEEQLDLIEKNKDDLEEKLADGYSYESLAHAYSLEQRTALNFYHNRRKNLEAKAMKKEALYASIKSQADPVINAFQKWHTLKVNLDRLRLFAESDDFKKQKMAFSHLSEYIQLTDEAWKEYQAIKTEAEQVVETSGKRGLKYFHSLLETANKWNH